MKRCTKCGVEQELEAFARNRTKPDGRQGHCKKCFKAMHLEEGKRDRRLQKRLGLEPGSYQKMLKEQGGVCKICGMDPSNQTIKRKYRLAVDHCHKTGKVRGLICITCNLVVAWLENCPEVLPLALKYLEDSK